MGQIILLVILVLILFFFVCREVLCRYWKINERIKKSARNHKTFKKDS